MELGHRYRTMDVKTSWVKVKSAAYSQMEGRRELFERRVGGKRAAANGHRRLVLA